MKRLESVISKEELYSLYIDQKLTQREIGSLKGIANGSVCVLMERYGILSRNRLEAMELARSQGRKIWFPCGPKNPARQQQEKKPVGQRRKKNPSPCSPHKYRFVYKPSHPRAGRNGCVLEHIIIWEQYNGPLSQGWVIHHIDGNKSNNNIENLQAQLRAAHSQTYWALWSKLKNVESENEYLRTRIDKLEIYSGMGNDWNY